MPHSIPVMVNAILRTLPKTNARTSKDLIPHLYPTSLHTCTFNPTHCGCHHDLQSHAHHDPDTCHRRQPVLHNSRMEKRLRDMAQEKVGMTIAAGADVVCGCKPALPRHFPGSHGEKTYPRKGRYQYSGQTHAHACDASPRRGDRYTCTRLVR